MDNSYIVPTTILKRSQVELFEKNPRIMTPQARKNLKKSIKKYGLVDNIIFNKRTGRIVGGHQRIDILDEIHKGKDYNIPCNVVDLDEKEEIRLNIILNNTSLQGEYDSATLVELIKQYEITDFENELFFDKADVEFMFSDMDFEITTNDNIATSNTINNNTAAGEALQKIKASEKQQNDRAKIDNRDNENRSSIDPVNDDYNLTFIFLTNKDKRDFMERLNTFVNLQGKTDYLSAEILKDMLDGKYIIKSLNTEV